MKISLVNTNGKKECTGCNKIGFKDLHSAHSTWSFLEIPADEGGILYKESNLQILKLTF
jgi:hypothetical protein